jgi:hypothetical protein
LFICKKEERSSQDISHAAAESTSEDSDSTDEGIDVDGKLNKLNLSLSRFMWNYA